MGCTLYTTHIEMMLKIFFYGEISKMHNETDTYATQQMNKGKTCHFTVTVNLLFIYCTNGCVAQTMRM